MNKNYLSCALALVLSVADPLPSNAQTIDYGGFEELFGEPVTTSATGTPQRLSDVALNMEIITAEEIRRSGAKQIPDVLKKLSGINVRQYTETQMEVGIRGYNNAFNDLILVLINGRQIYVDFYGYVVWDSLPVQLSEIRQIEIVKGPNTALFGFNAVSGVINIVTYNPIHDIVNTAEVSTGNHGYIKSNLVQTFKISDKAAFRYSIGREAQDRFDDDPIANQKLGSAFAPAISQRSSDNENGNFHFTYQPTDKTQIGLEYSSTNSGRNEVATSIYTHTDYAMRAYKANFSHDSEKFGLWEGMIYKNEVEADNLKVDSNQVWVAQLSNIFKLGTKHIIRLMGEYRDNRSDIISIPDPGQPFSFANNRVQYDIVSASAMWNWNATEKISTNNTVRYDKMEFDYKGPTNPPFFTFTEADYDARAIDKISVNSNLIYKHDENDTFRLGYAHGIDVPSFAEFSIMFLDPTIPPAGLGFQGNPNVPVATVDSYDLTYDHKFMERNIDLRASLFHQQFKDMQVIEAFDPTAPSVLTFGNGGDSQSTGVELGLKGKFHDDIFDWGMNYSYVHIKDDPNPGFSISKAAPSGNGVEAENMYPVNTLSGWLGYADGPWEADGFVTYYDAYEDVLPQLITNDPYPVDSQIQLSARIAYEVKDGLSVALSGKGLQGKHEEAGTQELEPEVYLSTTMNLDKLIHPKKKARFY